MTASTPIVAGVASHDLRGVPGAERGERKGPLRIIKSPSGFDTFFERPV
jgi:hypothetical protein